MAIKPRDRGGRPRSQREMDLHWLRGWGERIRLRLDTGRRLSELEGMVLNPDAEAAAAFKRLSAENHAATYTITQMHDAARAALSRYQASRSDNHRWQLAEAMDSLSRHIAYTVDAYGRIHEIETVAEMLPRKSKAPAIFRYLASRPTGVTFSEFVDYRIPGTAERLVETSEPQSVSAILRKHSLKLRPLGWKITTSQRGNLIKLEKLPKK